MVIHGVDAGALDQRITLQQRAAGVDALGQEAAAWTDAVTVWAAAEPLRGREYFAAAQTQSAVDVRFRIRWRAGVAASMRVLWRGVAHDITAVIEPRGARQELELMCTSGVKDGR